MTSDLSTFVSPAEIYRKYVDADNNVTWPEDQREKMLLARAIFGKWLIGKFDSWIDEGFDFVENPEPNSAYSRNNLMKKRDQYFRSGLKSLAPEQKVVVKQLVLEMIEGTLFGALVTLDQTRYGQYLLSLRTEGGNNPGETIPVAPDKYMDLHDELSEWILGFSKYAGQLLEVIDIKGGQQFSPIRPYA